jgi:hypothetical protein
MPRDHKNILRMFTPQKIQIPHNLTPERDTPQDRTLKLHCIYTYFLNDLKQKIETSLGWIDRFPQGIRFAPHALASLLVDLEDTATLLADKINKIQRKSDTRGEDQNIRLAAEVLGYIQSNYSDLEQEITGRLRMN